MPGLILPPAAWRQREGLAALCAAIFPAHFVGGAVRDTLLGFDVADVDLATPWRPELVMDRVKAAGIRAVPTGIDHGTVTAVLPSGPVEITTLRADVATDGRHAVVAFTADWAADAARRDFTMNALYADPATGEIFDHVGGLPDLAARRVRFIGDPRQRIAEDHLRILRFFRFHARFGDAIDPDGLAACTDLAASLMALSRERIAGELLRLLVTPGAVAAIRLMVERGILRPVLPEIDAAGVARLGDVAVAERSEDFVPDAVRRLAALLPVGTGDAIGARLKLSNAMRKRLASAQEPVGPEDAAVLAYRIGPAAAADRLLLADRGADAVRAAAMTPGKLPLSGGDLVARGVTRGPEVARLLRQVEERWIVEGFPPPARVAAIADAIVAQALREVNQA